ESTLRWIACVDGRRKLILTSCSYCIIPDLEMARKLGGCQAPPVATAALCRTEDIMPHPLASSPVYIVGAAEAPLGKVLDQNEFSMVAMAAQEALSEAGLGMRDVDAVFTNYMGEEGS